jgi:predicted small secreted protein
MNRAIIPALALAGVLFAVSACEDDDSVGEEAGEAVEETGEAIEDTAEEAEEEME